MSALTFGAVVVIVLAAFAGGYVWGWLNGSESAQHPDGPETCRAKLRAAETTAETYHRRVLSLEAEVSELTLAQAEHERAETATVQLLLAELDQAAAAVRTADDLGATALRALGALPPVADPIRDLRGVTTV